MKNLSTKIFPFFFILLFFKQQIFCEGFEEHFCYYPYEKQCYGIPSAQYPSSCDEIFMFVNGAYTLWTPYQDNMTLAVTNLVDPTSDDHPTKNWILPQTNYVNGFKAGIGLNTFHDGWKIYSQYTYFYHSPKIHTNDLNTAIYTYWSPFFSYHTINNQYHIQKQLNSKWKIFFQKIDLFLDRSFYAGKFLILAPVIGVTGAWDKQTLYINSFITESTKKEEWKSYQNYWGIGPCGGIDATYYIYDIVGFYLSSKAAILYSSYFTKIQSIQYNHSDDPNDLSKATIVAYTSYKPTDIQPMLESTIGIKLDLNGIDWGVQLQAGWELQVWFNHNQTSPFQITSNNQLINTITTICYKATGNYYMHGLTAGINLSF